MKAEDIKWCPQHGYPLPCYKCRMPLTQSQQKEVYQVGIREVVEFIRKEGHTGKVFKEGSMAAYMSDNPTVVTIPEDKLQAKLKEWGIE